MRTKITGNRNGAEWPNAGDVIDLPDAEALALVGAQAATLVDPPAVVDTVDVLEVATVEQPETPERRRPGRPRKQVD